MNIIPQIKNKSVLILGIGREGLSTYLFLRKHFPDKVLTIADKLSLSQLPEKTRSYISKDKKVKLILGENFIEKSIGFDIIFVSPGMSPLILEKIKNPQSIVSSNLELFFELCQGKIIGITGTKGKSTTTSLVYQVLIVRRRPKFLRTWGIKAILGASIVVNVLVMGAWVVLWFRYR